MDITDRIFRKLSLLEEERLCDEVRRYPVIYDKTHQLYKEKSSVAKAWTAIADSLEFLSDATCAQSSFENAKRRYLKRRVDYRKLLHKPDSSSLAFDRARRELNCYSFLFWLDEFLKNRRIKEVHESSMVISSDRSIVTLTDEDFKEGYDGENSETAYSPPVAKSPRIQSTFSLGNDHVTSKSVPNNWEKMAVSNERFHPRQAKFDYPDVKNEKDAEYYFAMSMAAEIRSFGEREKSLIKNEINNIIFKYQMLRHKTEHDENKTCASKADS